MCCSLGAKVSHSEWLIFTASSPPRQQTAQYLYHTVNTSQQKWCVVMHCWGKSSYREWKSHLKGKEVRSFRVVLICHFMLRFLESFKLFVNYSWFTEVRRYTCHLCGQTCGHNWLRPDPNTTSIGWTLVCTYQSKCVFSHGRCKQLCICGEGLEVEYKLCNPTFSLIWPHYEVQSPQ
jgi:hypothetical protein